MGGDTPDTKLSPEEYIKSRLVEQIGWYDDRSVWNKRCFIALRWTEVVAAALIPFLSGRTDPKNPLVAISIGVLGVLIAICAATSSLFQFQERWIEYRTTSESLKKEKFLYLTRVEPYHDDEAFGILVQRVETLVSKENTNWAQYMMKPIKEQNTHGPKDRVHQL